MNKNQELYTAIGAILKELKIELTNNLSDHVKINSDFNNSTSESIQLVIDAVADIENDLGSTKQALIDTHVDVMKEVETITDILKKLQEGDFANNKDIEALRDEITTALTNVSKDAHTNLKDAHTAQLEFNSDIVSTLTGLSTHLQQLSDSEFADLDFVADADKAVIKYVTDTRTQLEKLITDVFNDNLEVMNDNKARDAYVEAKLTKLVESIININSNVESLKLENINTDTQFKSVSEYFDTNKEMISEQLQINDTFSEKLEEVLTLVLQKTDGSELDDQIDALDTKLNTLTTQSNNLASKVSKLKVGKVIDDKIKEINLQLTSNTISLNNVQESVGDLNELLEDNDLNNVSQFKSIVDVIADLEKEFIDHKSKAFDELKSKTDEVDEQVKKITSKVEDMQTEISENEEQFKSLDDQIGEINEDIETVAHNMSTIKGKHEDYSKSLDDHIHKNITTTEMLKSKLIEHEDKFENTKENLDGLFEKINDQQESFNALGQSIKDSKSSVDGKLLEITGTVENTLADLSKGVVEENIKKSVLVDAKIFVKEQGELSDAMLIRKTDEFIVSLAANMKGEKGNEGNLSICEEWNDGDITPALKVITHHCGLWQCLSETDAEPAVYSKEWTLLASGINKVYTRLEGDEVKLVLVTQDSTGEEKTHNLEYPLPKFLSTWDEKEKYGYYDSVMKDGHRWISKSTHPEGDPTTSDDWAMFAMQGKRGAKGSKGDKGDIPPMSSIIKALNQAELEGKNPPIRRWTGLWKYNKSHEVGDLMSFDAGIWLTIANDNGSVPPSKIENKNFVLLLRSTSGGAGQSIFKVVGPIDDSTASDLSTLVADHNDLLAELRNSGIIAI